MDRLARNVPLAAVSALLVKPPAQYAISTLTEKLGWCRAGHCVQRVVDVTQDAMVVDKATFRP